MSTPAATPDEVRAREQIHEDFMKYVTKQPRIVMASFLAALIDQGWRKRIPKASQLVRERDEQQVRADKAEQERDEALDAYEQLLNLHQQMGTHLYEAQRILDREPPVVLAAGHLVNSRGSRSFTFEGTQTDSTWDVSNSSKPQIPATIEKLGIVGFIRDEAKIFVLNAASDMGDNLRMAGSKRGTLRCRILRITEDNLANGWRGNGFLIKMTALRPGPS